MEWILASSGLPKPLYDVLIYNYTIGEFAVGFIQDESSNRFIITDEHDGWNIGEVYWTNLPEKPKPPQKISA